MTDIVEAMARASFMRGWVVPGGMTADQLFALRKKTDPDVWRMHQENIRACHAAGGLVLREVPGEKAEPGHSSYAFGYARGHNDALAAVHAAAVEGV